MKKITGNEQHNKHFWTQSTKPVPGRPALKTDPNPRPCLDVKSTSYQEFMDSVEDAWDSRVEDLHKFYVQKNSLKDLSLVHKVGNCGDKTLSTDEVGLCGRESEPTLPEEVEYFNPIKKCTPNLDADTIKFETNILLFSKVLTFQTQLESLFLDLNELRRISWSGVPTEVRPVVWKLLSGYLPTSLERREPTLERKRLEYWNLVKQYFDSKRDESQEETYQQIHIDIPRMSPLCDMFQDKTVQLMYERILFIWAVRHPASGYVQGMNDLVTPFFIVFLGEFLPSGFDSRSANINLLTKEQLDFVEADSFWCFSKFLEGIQDNYIFAQLGIQSKLNQLKELVQRIDLQLHEHLESNGLDYLQFSFRWLNNLLTREIPLSCYNRLWDTYLAELDCIATFQLYVSAAFFFHWRSQLLQQKDFQGLITFLLNPPTQSWTDLDVGMLLAEAHRLKFMFADSPNHLQSITN